MLAVLSLALVFVGVLGANVQPAMDCDMAFNKKVCHAADGCYWCASTTFSGQQSVCVDAMEAKHFPTWFYKCTHSKPSDPAVEEVVITAQSGCDNPRTEEECLLDDSCVWCEGSFGPAQAHCMDLEQSKYVPKEFLKCHGKADPAPAQPENLVSSGMQKAKPQPQPGAGCASAVDKKGCLHSSACYWCDNKFTPGMGARCMDESEADFLPEMIFKCKRGKDPKPEPAPESDADMIVNADPTPAADPCTDAVDKKSCKKVDGCAWCENQFNPDTGSTCMNADHAKFIPASVFKCKASKKKAATLTADAAPAAPSCKDAKDKNDCKDLTGCAWCVNQFTPDSGSLCLNADHAKFIPATAYKCEAAKTDAPLTATPTPAADPCTDAPLTATPTPAADPCTDAKDKKGCKHIDGCAWCENQFNPDTGSTCMNADHAKFIPATVFKCKASKKQGDVARVAPAPQPGATCYASTAKKGCLKSAGCYWCTMSYGAGQCLDANQAKFLPATMYQCTAAQSETEDEEEETSGLLQAVKDVFASFIGAGDAPSPYSPPTPGPSGAGCTSAMDKDGCLDEKDCYWCENKFTPGMGDRCTDETQAKFLPDMVFKCKKAKHHKDELKHRKVVN